MKSFQNWKIGSLIVCLTTEYLKNIGLLFLNSNSVKFEYSINKKIVFFFHELNTDHFKQQALVNNTAQTDSEKF